MGNGNELGIADWLGWEVTAVNRFLVPLENSPLGSVSSARGHGTPGDSLCLQAEADGFSVAWAKLPGRQGPAGGHSCSVSSPAQSNSGW